MNSKGNVLSVNVEKGERIIPQKSLEQRVDDLTTRIDEIETKISSAKQQAKTKS